MGVHGIGSRQPLGPDKTLPVPSVFTRHDPQKENLSWRCLKCLQSTTMQSQHAGVCRWLGKPPQTVSVLLVEEALEVEGAEQGSPFLLYLLGFLNPVNGSFMLSVSQAKHLGLIFDSRPPLTFQSNPSANPLGSTFRISSDFDHFSPTPLLTQVPAPSYHGAASSSPGPSGFHLDRLWSILNMAAQGLLSKCSSEYVTIVLRMFHWLPDLHPVKSKVLPMICKAQHSVGPDISLASLSDTLPLFTPTQTYPSPCCSFSL